MGRHLRSGVFVLSAMGAVACGAAQRQALVVATDHRLEEAQASGAEETSPYEYYVARAHLAEVTKHSGNRQAAAAYSSADEAVLLPH